jgi:hypothetical protein
MGGFHDGGLVGQARRAGDACLDSAMTHRELAKVGIVSCLEQQHLEITVVGI